MTWNGVHFNLHTIIPWPVMVGWVIFYFAFLAWAWRPRGGKAFGSFKTIDFVYIALIAALLVVYHYFIAPLIPRVGSVTTYFNYTLVGDVFFVMLVAALVGKPGTVGLTMAVYDVVADITHYGFGGEPFWLISWVTSYGVVDLWLAYRGKYFMTPYRGAGKVSRTASVEELEEELRPSRMLFILDAVISGIAVFLYVPFWTRGFWGPFVHGFIMTFNFWLTTTITGILGGIVIGLLVAPFVYYVKKVLT